VLIDSADGFVFGYSKLNVMFGRTVPDAVVNPSRDLASSAAVAIALLSCDHD
jgi:hypothetical protein